MKLPWVQTKGLGETRSRCLENGLTCCFFAHCTKTVSSGFFFFVSLCLLHPSEPHTPPFITPISCCFLIGGELRVSHDDRSFVVKRISLFQSGCISCYIVFFHHIKIGHFFLPSQNMDCALAPATGRLKPYLHRMNARHLKFRWFVMIAENVLGFMHVHQSPMNVIWQVKQFHRPHFPIQPLVPETLKNSDSLFRLTPNLHQMQRCSDPSVLRLVLSSHSHKMRAICSPVARPANSLGN